MKVLVEHDKQGNISSFGIPAKKFAGQISLQPSSGNQVTEVDVAEIKDIGGEGEKEHERVLNLIKKSRLDKKGAKPKLTSK